MEGRLGRLVGKLINRQKSESQTTRGSVLINPAAEPDLARLEAFRIPGVLRGQIVSQSIGGAYIADWDKRDRFGRPVETFLPGAVHPNPDINKINSNNK